MLTKLRTHAPLAVAGLALFFAIGGPSFAADAVSSAAKLITGKQIKDSSITTADVKNGSLLKQDFKLGQLPAGPTGSSGPSGPQGPKGDKGDPCLASDAACRGPQGSAGPAATKLFFDQTGDDSVYPVASVGPWTIKATCHSRNATGGSYGSAVSVQGPGAAEMMDVESIDDGTAVLSTKGFALYASNPGTNVVVLSVDNPHYFRAADTLELHSGSTVVQVTYDFLVDNRNAPSHCYLRGAAVPTS